MTSEGFIVAEELRHALDMFSVHTSDKDLARYMGEALDLSGRIAYGWETTDVSVRYLSRLPRP